ncbi:MAG: hypothetical protein KAS93_00215 [Gammaproteobacteria bacterium]|nr:hypothetical protein [Gammaproteobacteria bacterium]
MVDTVRTIADVLVLLADNTSGDISPQDMRDMVVSLEALNPTTPISATITTQGVGSGDFYMMGLYDTAAADANLTQASTTVTRGSANAAHGAHAIAVAAAAGVTDGSTLVLTVTGTSITDAGVRTTSDSEIIVADGTAASTDDYFETVKKWIGQITYTLSSAGGTAYNFDFNYGFAAYEDNGNGDFELKDFVMNWYGGANDSGFEIEVHRHEATGWTYHATAFDPGSPALYKLSTDYVTETEVFNGDYGRWKRTGLSDAVSGSGAEGLIVHVTTTVNNSLEWLNAQLDIRTVP